MAKSEFKEIMNSFVIAIFMTFAFYFSVNFLVTYIPPYSEGQCYVPSVNSTVFIKIDKNYIFRQYSEIHIVTPFLNRQFQASFKDLGRLDLEKVECL